MTITVEFWHIVTMLLSYIGVLIGFSKYMFAQIDKRLQNKSDRIDAAVAHAQRLEKELADHKARMPLEYQRREDAIRFETILNAKLDSIGGRIERLMEIKTNARN